MKISEVTGYLESIAPLSLQENYDNAGLLTGDPDILCKGIMVSLDATEEVIMDAASYDCNLLVTHHPIIFGGLRKLNGKSYVEKAVIAAIKKEIAIYAIHTNLDNVIDGVNGRIASLLGLTNIRALLPRENTLRKLYTFVPVEHAESVRQAIFDAGGGQIGNYSECSFGVAGTGTYKPGDNTQPFAGTKGKRHQENELRIEVIFPSYREKEIIARMVASHPYEEVAYDVVTLANSHPGIGSGIIGRLPEPAGEREFLQQLAAVFQTPSIRHSSLLKRPVSLVAVCGGAGSFLIPRALSAAADFFVTADVKYHEFFDANRGMVIADVGHYESEQFTINLLQDILAQKFPNFAVLKTGVVTNPVHYFPG